MMKLGWTQRASAQEFSEGSDTSSDASMEDSQRLSQKGAVFGAEPYLPGLPFHSVVAQHTLSDMRGPAVVLVFGNSTALAVAKTETLTTALAVLFTWDSQYRIYTKSAVRRLLKMDAEGRIEWKGLRYIVDDMCLGQHLRRGAASGSVLDEVILNKHTKEWKDLLLLDKFQPLMVCWRPAHVDRSEDWQEQVQRALV